MLLHLLLLIRRVIRGVSTRFYVITNFVTLLILNDLIFIFANDIDLDGSISKF